MNPNEKLNHWPEDFVKGWKKRMNLLKDEKVEKIMGILKKNAITNEIQEEIKKILKRKSLIKRKEEDIIKILEGTHDLNNSNSE